MSFAVINKEKTSSNKVFILMADDNFIPSGTRRKAQRERQRSILVTPDDTTNTVQVEAASEPETSPAEDSTEENTHKVDNLLTDKNFKYPQDVGENPEQPHSVIFYINARERSSVGSAAALERDLDNLSGGFAGWAKADSKRKEQVGDENRATGEQVDILGSLFKAAGVYAGFKAGSAAANFLTAGSSSQAANLVSGAIGGYFGAEISENIGEVVLQANDTVRLLNTIQMHIPAPPTVSYGAKWNNTNLGAFGGAIAGGKVQMPENKDDLASVIKNTLAGNNSTANAMARGIIQGAANLPSQLGGGSFGDVFDVTTKTTLNPFREQLFEQMDFRSFAFNYVFAPKNETEFENVMQIIQLFKYHMHPELAEGKTIMIYPSEFNIEYMYKDERNTYINQISSCALTNMDVSYGGADFTTFQLKPGAPSQISMRLQFTELEMLVRKDGGITDDYHASR